MQPNVPSPPGIDCQGTSPSGAPRGQSFVLCTGSSVPAGTTVTGTLQDAKPTLIVTKAVTIKQPRHHGR